ncbi:urea ABC transporter ATP-binding subunit UrtE [Sulfitobacter sp. CW3]|uniref:urea ABC transporter ATP-binding subunit UrtE n=1 Tax=Sulfitobacter sp. CW3 TaxID=2861965 RepID=UPI001C5E3DF0|nr:urea ABC transporter ATP-binding subunit UrtE [Sulfitobacter sp. CW3]MBW4963659.1 urea ABC transporter ATP-binding subunit UrtE [Sulfitobacter sp. CW3]
MLNVENLDLHYGQSRILYEVSFTAPQGQITTMVGNNGVGKTSTLKAIAGRHAASGGTIKVDGKPVRLNTAFQAAKAGIAYVPQGREVFPMMTVHENLETGFACLPKSEHFIPDEVFDLFPVLREMQSRRGGDLSGGQQQQLAIARALITKPRVLLLDEPTEGIQPNVIEQIGDALRLLRSKGEMAILLVEQNADFAYALGDSFIVVEGGRNSPRKLKADYTKADLIADLAL